MPHYKFFAPIKNPICKNRIGEVLVSISTMSEQIILFDGMCNLCNRSVDFVLAKDQQNHFSFVALQSEKGQQIIQSYALSSDIKSIILINNHHIFVESDAALEIARLLPAPWKWMTIFSNIPAPIRNRIYRWIAQHRYSLFGKRTSCRNIKR